MVISNPKILWICSFKQPYSLPWVSCYVKGIRIWQPFVVNSFDASDGIFWLWASVSCLLMPWFPKSPDHQQAWYWLYRKEIRFIIMCQEIKKLHLLLVHVHICIRLECNSHDNDCINIWYFVFKKVKMLHAKCFCSGLNVFVASGNIFHGHTYNSLCMDILQYL